MDSPLQVVTDNWPVVLGAAAIVALLVILALQRWASRADKQLSDDVDEHDEPVSQPEAVYVPGEGWRVPGAPEAAPVPSMPVLALTAGASQNMPALPRGLSAFEGPDGAQELSHPAYSVVAGELVGAESETSLVQEDEPTGTGEPGPAEESREEPVLPPFLAHILQAANSQDAGQQQVEDAPATFQPPTPVWAALGASAPAADAVDSTEAVSTVGVDGVAEGSASADRDDETSTAKVDEGAGGQEPVFPPPYATTTDVTGQIATGPLWATAPEPVREAEISELNPEVEPETFGATPDFEGEVQAESPLVERPATPRLMTRRERRLAEQAAAQQRVETAVDELIPEPAEAPADGFVRSEAATGMPPECVDNAEGVASSSGSLVDEDTSDDDGYHGSVGSGEADETARGWFAKRRARRQAQREASRRSLEVEYAEAQPDEADASDEGLPEREVPEMPSWAPVGRVQGDEEVPSTGLRTDSVVVNEPEPPSDEVTPTSAMVDVADGVAFDPPDVSVGSIAGVLPDEGAPTEDRPQEAVGDCVAEATPAADEAAAGLVTGWPFAEGTPAELAGSHEASPESELPPNTGLELPSWDFVLPSGSRDETPRGWFAKRRARRQAKREANLRALEAEYAEAQPGEEHAEDDGPLEWEPAHDTALGGPSGGCEAVDDGSAPDVTAMPEGIVEGATVDRAMNGAASDEWLEPDVAPVAFDPREAPFGVGLTEGGAAPSFPAPPTWVDQGDPEETAWEAPAPTFDAAPPDAASRSVDEEYGAYPPEDGARTATQAEELPTPRWAVRAETPAVGSEPEPDDYPDLPAWAAHVETDEAQALEASDDASRSPAEPLEENTASTPVRASVTDGDPITGYTQEANPDSELPPDTGLELPSWAGDTFAEPTAPAIAEPLGEDDAAPGSTSAAPAGDRSQAIELDHQQVAAAAIRARGSARRDAAQARKEAAEQARIERERDRQAQQARKEAERRERAENARLEAARKDAAKAARAEAKAAAKAAKVAARRKRTASADSEGTAALRAAAQAMLAQAAAAKPVAQTPAAPVLALPAPVTEPAPADQTDEGMNAHAIGVAGRRLGSEFDYAAYDLPEPLPRPFA